MLLKLCLAAHVLCGCLYVSTSGDPLGNLRIAVECRVERGCASAWRVYFVEACEDVVPASKRVAEECARPGGEPRCDVPTCRVECREIAEPCAADPPTEPDPTQSE